MHRRTIRGLVLTLFATSVFAAGCSSNSSSQEEPGSDASANDIGTDVDSDTPVVEFIPAPSGTVRLDLSGEEVVFVTDERFLSVAVDSSQVAGGKFWGTDGGSSGGLGNEDLDPYDFSRPRLRALAAHLAPAYMRIGGSEADVLYYDMSDDPVEEAPEPYDEVFTAQMWDDLSTFAHEVGFTVFFTLNAGPGPRDDDRAWQPEQARALIDYANASGTEVPIWELGNEINGFPVFHGLSFRIDGQAYARDMERLAELRDELAPRALIAGPSSAMWAIAGEPSPVMPAFLEAGGDTVDVVTWHFYPAFSERCPVRPREALLESYLTTELLDEVAIWAHYVEELVAEHARTNTQMWLGESGSAYCGGQAGVSTTFVTTFWWLDELGQLARRGHSVVVRQSLTGADYGLLNEETLEPRPDYWASVLWNQWMGRLVLDISGERPAELRAYAHCAPAEDGSASVVVLNIGNRTQSVAVSGGDSTGSQVYVATADAIDAEHVKLNGTELVVDDQGALPFLQGIEATRDASDSAWLELPPHSWAFLTLPSAALPACSP